MRKFPFCAMALVLAMALAPAGSSATELIYRPLNPSFGGDPLLGGFLLNKADAQKRFDLDLGLEEDPLADFESGLNRRVLSLLADKIVQEAFGSSGELANGTYNIGGYVISVDNSGGAIKVAITDSLSGESTVVEVPVF